MPPYSRNIPFRKPPANADIKKVLIGLSHLPDKLVFGELLHAPLAPLACEGGGPEGRGEKTAVR